MQKRRALRITVLATILAGSATCAALDDHVLVRNLRVVEPGAIIRGAEQKPWPLARVIDGHAVRTVLCLADPEPHERDVVEGRGVRWICIPLGESGTRVLFDELESAARVLAEPSNWPVFFHCKRGMYRSNLVQAVYRMKCCRWTLEQALAELRTQGFDVTASGGDNCCAELLKRYYSQRINAPL